MKKFKALFLPFIFIISNLTGCDSSKSTNNEPYFEIKASNHTYFLDDVNNRPVYSVNLEKSKTDGLNVSDLRLEVVQIGTTGAKALSTEANVEASKTGTFKVIGKIGSIKSKNLISIDVKYSNNYLTERIKSIFSNPLVFGETYDIGIAKKDVEKYSIVPDSDIVRINDEGKVEVYGLGTNVNFAFKHEQTTLTSGQFSIEENMLTVKIYEKLIEERKVSNFVDSVTHDSILGVKSLDFHDILIKNSTGIEGLRVLENLEKIDLSNNCLSSADFLKELKNLKEVNLSNNKFNYLSFLEQSASSIESLNLSNNRFGSGELGLENFKSLKSLDLSHNYVGSIEFLSNLTSLESLNLNNNKIFDNYIDTLVKLENLKELKLGYTDVSFESLGELPYKEKIVSIDLSGQPYSEHYNEQFPNIEKLIIQDSGIDDKELELINLQNFSNLKELDISNNELYSSRINELIVANSLNKLEKLSIGKNHISTIPTVVKQLSSLKSLDASNSYYLYDVEELSGSNIEELILDECNYFGSLYASEKYYGVDFVNTIESLTNLKKLSIVGSLEHLTKTYFDKLLNNARDKHFALRVIGNEFLIGNDINALNSAISYSFEEFKENNTYLSDGIYRVNDFHRHLIINLSGDTSAEAQQQLKVCIPAYVTRIDVYGNKGLQYNMNTYLYAKKVDDVELNLRDFNDKLALGRTFVENGDNVPAKLTVNHSINSMVRIGELNAIPKNCGVDNGWNVDQPESADWASELKMNIFDYYIDGVTKRNNSYILSKSDELSMSIEMNYDYNKIPFKDGRDDTRGICNDSNASNHNIADSGVQAINGYGTLVVNAKYENGSKETLKTIGNFFQNRSANETIQLFNSSEVINNVSKLKSLDIYIAFEIEHAQGFIFGAKYSNWLYKFSLNFIYE